MTKIAIICGSTRPGRNGDAVARWVKDVASARTDAEFDLIDLAQVALPLLDEPMPPSLGIYSQQHTLDWAATISRFDGFVVVTAEYNHSIPAALKNALDYLYAEWNNKAAGFVSYGTTSGGTRAVEHLRLVMAELQVATVRDQVALSVLTDFENYTTFNPAPHHAAMLSGLLDQVVAWSEALSTLRVAA